MIAFLRNIFLEDFWLKLFSLALAVMIWLYIETGDEQKISAFSLNVFWLIIPSLALFLVLPLMIKFGWGFWLSVMAAVLATAACYGLMLSILKQFGI